MIKNAVFQGLVFDDNDQLLNTTFVGNEACYVINDDGFMRHIPAEIIDKQVVAAFRSQVENNKDLIAEQTIKMIGDVDIFTHGIIKNQLENLDDQFDYLLKNGIPEDTRVYMGMLGFKIIVDYHGNVIRVEQPATLTDDED
ncbi:MAG: hypothetical protein J7K66_00935 [Anaerolineaceae bacterium]|nr:hypothetical protein [Anaerolineaceae bacterium]